MCSVLSSVISLRRVKGCHMILIFVLHDFPCVYFKLHGYWSIASTCGVSNHMSTSKAVCLITIVEWTEGLEFKCEMPFGLYPDGSSDEHCFCTIDCFTSAWSQACLPQWASSETWLILPVVICLSQRLSHACLGISFYMAKLWMAH